MVQNMMAQMQQNGGLEALMQNPMVANMVRLLVHASCLMLIIFSDELDAERGRHARHVAAHERSHHA